MTAINHGLTGVAIGVVLQNPLAIPLAFVSHFLLDSLPHFGLKKRNKVFVTYLFFDALATFLLLLWALFISSQPFLLSACLLVAISPDFVWAYYWYKEIKYQAEFKTYDNPLVKFHARIQWFEKPVGIIVEVFWAAAMLLIITNNLA